ncbi:unnamed protein product [Arctia plantaginis]|uniref:Uncharacterized protein n=1 Tax=Arctia plantaginis TaxID=874455 RepID=A0A8S1AUS4_ARCPL|nr:unnamed protein product [Arctia plantaginis]
MCLNRLSHCSIELTGKAYDALAGKDAESAVSLQAGVQAGAAHARPAPRHPLASKPSSRADGMATAR